MKFLKNKIKNIKYKKGFILPFAILIATLILSISLGVSTILVKEIFFSNLNRESSISYYAADVAMECALSIDDLSATGIFENGDSPAPITATDTLLSLSAEKGTTFSSTTVYCAGIPIFDSRISNLVVEDCVDDSFCEIAEGDYQGRNSIFDMRMSLGNNEYRCANVTVTKTGAGGRRIIARGYNTCDANNPNIIERAIINISEAQ